MTPAELRERTWEFNRRTKRFCIPLLRHIEHADPARQLRRAAASTASNYRAVCIARTRRICNVAFPIGQNRRDPLRGLGADVAVLPAVKVRDLVAMLRKNGWVEASQVGSHQQFKHPTRPGRVTVSGRANADLPTGTLRSVYRQAGLDWKSRDQ